jgi:DNA-binding NtrC family response regulator
MKSRSVVVVDSDVRLLDQVAALLDATHVVLATADARRAIAWLHNDTTVCAVIAAQNLRGANGLDVLTAAQKVRPEARRILVADYEDLSAIIPCLHSGVVERTIAAPIDPRELVGLLRLAPVPSRQASAGHPAARPSLIHLPSR